MPRKAPTPASLIQESNPGEDLVRAKAVSDRDLRKLDEKIKRTQNVLLNTKDYVEVMIAPQYNGYFGNVMTVQLNGLSIYVPVDGRAYKVAKPYAAIIHERLRKVNELLTTTNRMANVTQNAESYAGELTLIPR